MLKKHWKILIWSLFIAVIMLLALIDLNIVIPEKWASMDNVRHIAAFTVLIIISRITFPACSLLKILFMLFVLGITIEVAQELFTNGIRKFYLMDVVNNAIGMTIGIAVVVTADIIKRSSKKSA